MTFGHVARDECWIAFSLVGDEVYSGLRVSAGCN